MVFPSDFQMPGDQFFSQYHSDTTNIYPALVRQSIFPILRGGLCSLQELAELGKRKALPDERHIPKRIFYNIGFALDVKP